MLRNTLQSIGALFLLALVTSSSAFAEDVGQPLAVQCCVPVDPEWLDGEKYVWRQVCVGKEANLLTEYPGDSDPKNAEHWPPERTLRPQFLETILLNDKYRKALTRVGVRITGARFKERVNLENAEIRHELWLQKSRLEHGADFSGLKSTRLILLSNSVISDHFDKSKDEDEDPKEHLNIQGAEIGGNLYLDNAHLKEVRLSNSVIRGELALGGSKVSGEFEGNDLTADSITTGRETEFAKAVSLARAHIKADLAFNDRVTFRKVDLTRAKIDGDLNLYGGTFLGSVDLTGVKVDGNVDLSGGSFSETVDLTGAKIGGNLGLIGGQFYDSVKLPGVQITGDLGLSREKDRAIWLNNASLDLGNAKADRIPGVCDAWPTSLNFGGFVYRAIGPIPPNDKCPEGAENALGTWLDKFAPPASRGLQGASHDSPDTQLRSTQPYEQLAAVLQTQGDVTNAREVRYKARDKERQQSGWLGRLLLLVPKYFVGYGYYFEWAFIPVFALLIAGIAIMRLSGEAARIPLPWWGAAYTLDMLLPLIRLREWHYTITLAGWAQTYFYFHKIMGYVLASVLIAAAAGLGK